jgi:hypothetical protein
MAEGQGELRVEREARQDWTKFCVAESTGE